MQLPFSKFVFLIAFLIISVRGETQGRPAPATRLTVGNKVPPLLFENIVNAPYPEFHLDNLKDKPILLEFWTSRCGVCMQMIYELGNLQRKFQKELQIMTITPDTKEMILDIYRKQPAIKALGLPSVVADQRLGKLFPVQMVPHFVWIGKDRTIVAMTGHEAVTEENIRRFIRNESLAHLPVKEDAVDFDYEGASLFLNGPLVTQNILRSSLLTRELKGVSGRMGMHTTKTHRIIRGTNQSILGLYAFAYRYQLPLQQRLFRNRILLKNSVGEPGLFHPNYKEPYCYEAQLPMNSNDNKYKQEIYRFMQKDLDRLFDVQSSVQKLYKMCYVMMPMVEIKDLPTGASSVVQQGDSTVFTNCTLSILVAHIEAAYPLEHPLICEGDLGRKVSLTLPNKFQDLAAVEHALEKLGYSLKMENRWIEMLVFE